MTFYDVIEAYRSFDFDSHLAQATPGKIEAVLSRDSIGELDFLQLLSGPALAFLEPMAQKASAITRSRFGNSVQLFTPLYLSNLCTNVCPYCSFARQHHIARRHLSLDEVREECKRIGEGGIRHILLLTGESPAKASVEYLTDSVRIAGEYFSSISIEVYPLTAEAYGGLIEEGVDGLAIFQEIYDENAYGRLHRGGPKENYRFRLEAPDRAACRGIRTVTVGALMGLGDLRREAFFTALHAHYLQKTYSHLEVSLAFPRIRPLAGEFVPPFPVDDTHFVQVLLAARIFLQSAGITITTRESGAFRDAILPLGVTKMSAGVSTAVGGHSRGASTAQFEIADTRSVAQMKADLLAWGYQPVMQDWNSRFLSPVNG